MSASRATRKRKASETLRDHVDPDEAAGHDAHGAAPLTQGRAHGAAAAADLAKALPQGAAAPGQIPINGEQTRDMHKKIQEYEQAAQDARDKFPGLLSAGEVDTLVGAVVRLMLFKMYEKPEVPVRRQDLVDVIQADYKDHKKKGKKLPALIIPLAQAKMASVFGLELVEIRKAGEGSGRAAGAAAAAQGGAGGGEGADGAAAAGGSGGGGGSAAGPVYYKLNSMLPSAVFGVLVTDPNKYPKHGFLMMVLGLLQLNGGAMEEEELWRQLGVLSMGPGTQVDNLGDPAHLITELINTKLLSKGKGQGPRADKVLLHWGDAAVTDIGEAEVKAFVDRYFTGAQQAMAANALTAARRDQENRQPDDEQ